MKTVYKSISDFDASRRPGDILGRDRGADGVGRQIRKNPRAAIDRKRQDKAAERADVISRAIIFAILSGIWNLSQPSPDLDTGLLPHSHPFRLSFINHHHPVEMASHIPHNLLLPQPDADTEEMVILSPDHFLALPRPDILYGGAPAGAPDTSTLAAHDFDVDTRTGFMPPQPPLTRLPPQWELWELALSTLR